MLNYLIHRNLSTLVVPPLAPLRVGYGDYKDKRDSFAMFLSLYRHAVLLPLSGQLLVEKTSRKKSKSDPADDRTDPSALISGNETCELLKLPISTVEASVLLKDLTSLARAIGFKSSGTVWGHNELAEYSYNWQRFKMPNPTRFGNTGYLFEINYFHETSDLHLAANVLELFDTAAILKLRLVPRRQRIIIDYANGRSDTYVAGERQLRRLQETLEGNLLSTTLDEPYLKTRSERIIKIGGNASLSEYTLTRTQKRHSEPVFQLADLEELTTEDLVDGKEIPKSALQEKLLATRLLEFADRVGEFLHMQHALPFGAYENIRLGSHYWKGRDRPCVRITGICDASTRQQIRRLLTGQYPPPSYSIQLAEKFTESTFEYSLILLSKRF